MSSELAKHYEKNSMLVSKSNIFFLSAKGKIHDFFLSQPTLLHHFLMDF